MDDHLDFDPPIPRRPAIYTEVKKAHIVPRMYLDLFADSQQQIQVVLTSDDHTFKTSTRGVATRPSYYGRVRPDGSKIFDVEWSLSILEGQAAPVLRGVEATWPLDFEKKATLAQLFGLQLVRGPKWTAWRNTFVKRTISRMEREGTVSNQVDAESGESPRARLQDEVLSDSERLLRMQLTSAQVAAVMGSMTWDLIAFEAPCLALGDHPISVWPIGQDSLRPRPAEAGDIGLSNFFEVRVPVSPQLAILMYWGDRADAGIPIVGKRGQSRNLNSFSIFGADREWFHHPDFRVPSYGMRSWRSLTSEVVDGYSHHGAAASPIRRRVSENLNNMVGKGIESLDEHGRSVMEMMVCSD